MVLALVLLGGRDIPRRIANRIKSEHDMAASFRTLPRDVRSKAGAK